MAKRPGLYANIHAKRKRIKAGSKEKMRKKGQKGRPTKAREKEIKRTAKLYRQNKLTPAMMDKISKRRSKS